MNRRLREFSVGLDEKSRAVIEVIAESKPHLAWRVAKRLKAAGLVELDSMTDEELLNEGPRLAPMGGDLAHIRTWQHHGWGQATIRWFRYGSAVARRTIPG